MRIVTRVFVLILGAALAISCGGGGGGEGPTSATPTPRTYSGLVSGDMTFTIYTVPTTSPPNYCYATRTFNGTLKITLTQATDGTVTGTGETTGTEAETAMTPVSNLCNRTFGTVAFIWNRPVTGTSAKLAFDGQTISLPGAPEPSGGTTTSTNTNKVVFTGALSGDTISGTLTVSELLSSVFPHPQVASVDASGSVSFPVTLR